MYSGVGGEVLYQPFESRLAFGLSVNHVKQRDFDKSFKHLDYETTTGFLSAYWATPFYNFDLALHTGRYLAKDFGSTFEARRTFPTVGKLVCGRLSLMFPLSSLAKVVSIRDFSFESQLMGLRVETQEQATPLEFDQSSAMVGSG